MGQKGGQTNAFFFDTSGRQIASIDIRVEKDTTDLAKLIKLSFPDTDIKAQAINDTVVLTGHVASVQEAQRAADIAASFTGDAKKVVNVLAIRSSEQVMLKVRIAEMQRSVSKQLGIDLSQASTTIGGTVISGATSNPYGIVGSALSDLSQIKVSNGNLSGTLKALESVGLVHILAEPNLTAVSGETAKFLAGGEYPVPSGRDSSGNVSVSFKQYGIGLSFTPVVLGPGRISLQLSTEVSELTNTGSYTLQGSTSSTTTTIPALSVRRAETTVEVPSGGSFAIAGLMQHTTKQVLEGFPGAKDLPILGALFRSRDFSNEETELVVLVTAYLVKPATETKFAASTDGFVVPTDAEALLLGRLNAIYSRDSGGTAKTAEAAGGYIVQ